MAFDISALYDASFNSVDFWELSPEGRYAPYAQDEERIIVGQTVITRYTKPVEVQIQGLTTTANAGNLEGLQGSSHTLVWHRGSDSALLTRCETKHTASYGLAELTLTFIL